MSSPLIEIATVSKVYGVTGAAVHALKRIDLTVERGEFVAVMGPSGSGKSTLMHILGLLDRPTEGRYFFAGDNVSALGHDKLAEYRNQHIGFIFQGFNLLSRATALENVSLPLIYRGLGRAERHNRAVAALESVGLGHRLHHRPQQLSGGEQQRVAIARATVGDPLLLLADEPTGALDSETGAAILALFQALNSSGRTIVLITHELSVARHGRRIVSLRDGQVIGDEQIGASRQVMSELAVVPV